MKDRYTRNLHVEELLVVVVKLAIGLMDLKEASYHILIDIVSDGLLNLFHVKVESLLSPTWVMRETGEYPFDNFVRLDLFK